MKRAETRLLATKQRLYNRYDKRGKKKRSVFVQTSFFFFLILLSVTGHVLRFSHTERSNVEPRLQRKKKTLALHRSLVRAVLFLSIHTQTSLPWLAARSTFHFFAFFFLRIYQCELQRCLSEKKMHVFPQKKKNNDTLITNILQLYGYIQKDQ